MKSREEMASEIQAIAGELSMLNLIRLLYCARALRKKDVEMWGEKTWGKKHVSKDGNATGGNASGGISADGRY